MSIHLIDLILPHYCCSCGRIGSILCEYCKYDIVYERFSQCIVCLCPVAANEQLCTSHRQAFQRAWCVGERRGALERLIDVYKFERARSACAPLVDLLDDTLPILPTDTVVVPVPTIMTHVRQRGYGHVERVARALSRRRGLAYRPLLVRRTNAVQRGASRRVREKQAAAMFTAESLGGGRYLIVDDVFTTGATLRHAAKVLREAGASEVWVAVISRQPLEE